MGDNDAKERLVDVTIKMICDGKKPSEITVKDITERAELGNGMVNYHFQSKDNLIRLAVKKVMDCATKLLSEKMKSKQNLSDIEILMVILKEVVNFIANNSEISKIAILDDLENNQGTAHLLSIEESYNKCLRNIYGNDSYKIGLKNYLIAGYINYIFLKAENIKNEIGFDFYNKEDREKAIENLVSELVKCDNLDSK